MGKQESSFSKSRRRYGQATTAILSCVAIALWVTYQASFSGWPSIVPTKALILAMPFSDAEGNVYRELRKRMLVESISDFEMRMFLNRCAAGDWWARPPGSSSEDAWVRKYGAALNQWRRALVLRGEVTGYARIDIDSSSAPYNEFERLLMDIPPMIQLSIPPQWPSDVDPRLQVRLQHWWPSGSEARISLVREDDSEHVITINQGNVRSRASFAVALQDIDAAATDVRFRVVVDRRRPGLDEPWQPVSEHRFQLPLLITDDVAAWPEPVDDEATRIAIQKVFQGHAIFWRMGRVPVRFRYDPSATFDSDLDGVAVATAVRLMRGDEVARQLNIWWLGGLPEEHDGTVQPRGIGWEVAFEDRELLEQLEADDDRWHFVIEGRPELAILAGKADRFWSGSFTVPLQLTVVGSVAPAPEWRRADRE